MKENEYWYNQIAGRFPWSCFRKASKSLSSFWLSKSDRVTSSVSTSATSTLQRSSQTSYRKKIAEEDIFIVEEGDRSIMSLSQDICIYKSGNKKDKFMRGKGFDRRKLHFGPIFGRAPCLAPWQLGGRNLWSPEKVSYPKVSWLFYLFWKTSWDLDSKYAVLSIWWLAVVINFWCILDNSLGRSFFSQKARLTKAT